MRSEYVRVPSFERTRAELVGAIAESGGEQFDPSIIGGTHANADHHDFVLNVSTTVIVHRGHGVGQFTVQHGDAGRTGHQRFVEHQFIRSEWLLDSLLFAWSQLHARQHCKEIDALAGKVAVREQSLATQRAFETRPTLKLLRAQLALEVRHELVQHLRLLGAPRIEWRHDLLKDCVAAI